MSLRRVVGRLSRAEIDALDARRGEVPRAAMIRACVRTWLEAGGPVVLPPREEPARPPRLGGLPSLRRRLVAALDARPGDVLTPPQLTRIVGARPDGVRNALLELAARGKVEKVGEGQYRARARQEISASEAEAAEPMRGAA
jgi:hypothetical protein